MQKFSFYLYLTAHKTKAILMTLVGWWVACLIFMFTYHKAEAM